MYNVSKINVGPVRERNIDLAAVCGTLTTLPLIAVIFMAFRFLQAGASVSLWQSKHQETVCRLIYVLNYLFCLLVIAIEATAQFCFAKYLTHRYIKNDCTSECLHWTAIAASCQQYVLAANMIAVLVLVLALYMIRLQEVVKKSPNNFLLMTMALICLAQVMATIALNILIKMSQNITIQTQFVLNVTLLFCGVLSASLICFVLIKILHVEYNLAMTITNLKSESESYLRTQSSNSVLKVSMTQYLPTNNDPNQQE